MILVHFFFLLSLAVIAYGVYYWVRLLRGRPQLAGNGEPLPWWAWATIVSFGSLGVAASAPGLFFDQPHWFDDKIFWVVERLLGLFT